MKVILALLALCAVSSAYGRILAEENYQFLFTKWVEQHGKAYASPDEFQTRYMAWKSNMDYVLDFPNKFPNATWTVGMNQYADLTLQEFKAKYLGYRRPANRTRNVVHLPTTGLPTSVDWRTKGAVTPVKNQGDCGSCWAFSTTGSMEGILAITTGTLTSFSEQELVDCSGSAGNQGCEGGLMDNAFTWIVQNGGLCTEDAYPYQGVDGTCNESSCTSAGTITGHVDVNSGDENALLAAAAQQPVSVAVEADQSYWQLYTGGVLSDPGCGTNLDHGVLIVGYGTDSGTGQNYWIVKNSWGASWGESGYIRLVRGQDECGINTDPSYPTA